MTDLELAVNRLRDIAFIARNLRPRNARALNFIEEFANSELKKLGATPSTAKCRVILRDKSSA